MNDSNDTEVTEYTLDEWYDYFGVTFEMDIAYVYALTPTSLASFGFNCLTFAILLDKKFNLSIIYSYLRLYIFNSLIISFILTTTFVSNTYRIFSFTNTFGSITYGVYVFTPILTVLYFYSNLLEICIIMERTEKYLPTQYRLIKNSYFNKVCLGLFIFSVVLNIPTFISCYTAVENVHVADNSTRSIYFWGISDFSASVYGKVITFVIFFIRDFFFLFLKLVLNVISVFLIHKYLAKLNDSSKLNIIGLSKIKVKKPYLSNTDKSLTKMVITATILSIVENTFFALANGYYLIVIDKVSGYLILASYMAVALKHGSNFFVFLAFNQSFRTTFMVRFC